MKDCWQSQGRLNVNGHILINAEWTSKDLEKDRIIYLKSEVFLSGTASLEVYKVYKGVFWFFFFFVNAPKTPTQQLILNWLLLIKRQKQSSRPIFSKWCLDLVLVGFASLNRGPV